MLSVDEFVVVVVVVSLCVYECLNVIEDEE